MKGFALKFLTTLVILAAIFGGVFYYVQSGIH